MDHGQVHHIEYYVDDLAVTKEFWGWFLCALGWELMQEFEDGVSFIHQKSKSYIVFVQTTPEFSGLKNNRQGRGLNHLAFYSQESDLFADFRAELPKRGSKILYDEEKYLCFEEANGFAVEIYL